MPTSITLPDSLADRIGIVAQQSHRTPLCIIQLCLQAHLPTLEEAAKHLAVFHPEMANGKLPSPAGHTTLSSTEITADQIWAAVATVTKRKKGSYIVATLAAGKLFPGWSVRMCLKALKIPSQNHKRIVDELADSDNIDYNYITEANAVVKLLQQ